MKYARWILLAAMIIPALVAGSILVVRAQGVERYVDADQLQREPGPGVTLGLGEPVGQTFVARHGGLESIEVFLSASSDARGTVVLHLLESPISTTDILTASISVPAGNQEGFYRFSFPPIRSSHTGYYYAYLEYQGKGHVKAARASLNSYLDGALYLDHEPQDAQMVFRLSYDSVSIALDLLGMVVGWVAYGLAGLAVLFSSGYWLVCRWARKVSLDFSATLVASSIAALSAWMVFLVWASLFATLNALTVRLIVGASCILGVIQFARDRERWRRKEYWLGESPLSTLALWSVVMLAVALRLFVGRGMVVLPGGDTYHHTLIAQLFEEQGGIPRSYEPYAPLISFSYHFGFHSIVALVRWLFDTELLLATKTVALVLNGAVAATVALVAERWAGNRRAGVIAAAFAGLIMVSPFCLLRWGRFTQTTGLLLLAGGLLALTALGEGAGWVQASLLVAGMVLSHYRVAFLWMLFAVIASGARLAQRRWREVRDWVVLGVLSLVAVAPWLVRAAWVQYDPSGLRAVSPVLEGMNDLQRLEAPVLSYITNWPVLAVAILCAVVVWFYGKNARMGRPLVIWCLVMAGGALAVAAFGVNVPFFDLKTTLLSMAVPVAILAGLSGEILWSSLKGRGRTVARAGIVMVLVSGIAIGILRLPRMVQEMSFYLLRPGDLVTMKWIRENVREDALILVDALEFNWQPGWIVGIDSGYVLPLLAHRTTTVPPMTYPLEWGEREQLGAMLEASREYLARHADGSVPLAEILERHGITHVYVGAPRLSLDPSELAQEERLTEVYRQDRNWVFELTE
jgi:hypothetical protein